MNRRHFLGTMGLSAAAVVTGLGAPAKKPNIIFVLADDLGYGDLGCYGQTRIKTPNIDRLASEGVRFTQAYAGSTVCAPSRCCLETGYHTGHARTRGNMYPNLPLRPQDVSLGEIMKQAGYRTGLYGKWSLGGIGTTGYPLEQGYDEFFGYFNQSHAHEYYPEVLMDNRHEYLARGNMGASQKEYAHDLFARRSVDFVGKGGGQPFFLYCSFTIPHANNELGRDTGDGMQVPDYGEYADEKWPNPEKGFAAMISRMDRDVGRLVEKLKETGQDKNTLIIFSSDNGPHKEGGHDPNFFESSGAVRGIKRDMYEGGIRVPTIAWWPGTIQSGRVSNHPWAFWDVMPTFAELAGANAPTGIDGMSIVPELMGQPQKTHDYFYWEFHEGGFKQAVRMDDWKGVRNGVNKPLELYNLAEDLRERKNLAAANPGIVRKLEEILAGARTESEFWPVR